MSYQLEDYVPDWREQRVKDADLRLDQLRHQVGVAEKMSELQADPRWAIYGNHLEAVKADFERLVKRAQEKLLDGGFLGLKIYGQLKLDLASAEGVIKGIQIALDLAKQLIARGEDAAKEAGDQQIP